MAKAGLSFANPLLSRTGVGEAPNPYAPLAPTSSIGLGGLGQSAADMALLGEQLAAGSQFTLPEMRKPPAIAFSPSRKELYVQGQTFAADDASRALQSEALLGGPGVDLPQGGDWVPLDEQAYQQYLQSIREPTLGRLASKSFGRGVDVTQALAGRALQLAGAEELGSRIVSAQEEDLAKTQPYERMFTDIESGRDAVEWLVANFAQQGPNLIESLFTAGAGYLVGTATGGPLAGAGGALAGLMGKTAFKESVKAAARKKAAGEALTTAENKLLREAAGIAGAVTASYAQNLATGAADIYGELREQGATAEDTDARIRALLGSIPYAALETLPEYLLASRVLGGTGAPRAIPAGTSLGRRGLEYARRGGVGFGIGGLAEGTTEAGQEALLLGISGQELGTDASLNRLINSFAAGFGVGGPIGGVANLRGNAPANLLNPAQNTDPVPKTPTPPAPPSEPRLPLVVAPGTQGDLFGGVGPVSAIPGVALGAAAIPGVAGQYTPVGGFGVAPATEMAITQQDLFDTGQVQGDLFGGPPPLVGPVAPAAPPVEAPAPAVGVPVIPGQIPLDFAPPAPAGVRFTGQQPIPDTQIAQQLEALRRQQEFDLAMAQRREAEIAQAEAQRQLQLVPPAPTTQLPTPRQARPAEPQQLPLFGARGLPRPSGAERLRRGATPLPEPSVTVPVTPRESLQVAGQLPLFTQEGQPSVAALKGAGLRRKVVPVEEKGGKQRPSEPAAKIRQVVEKIRKRQRVDQTFDDGTRFVGLIDNEGNLVSGVVTYPDGATFEGTFRGVDPYNGKIVYADKSEAKVVKGEPTLTKEAPSAVQERKAEEVPTREPAGTGKEVGAGVPGKRETPRKGETLKKGKPREEPPARKAREEVTRPKAEAAVAAKTAKLEPLYASPEEAWEDFAPDDVPWSALTDEEKNIWSGKLRGGGVTQALAIRIAEDAKQRIGSLEEAETDVTVLDALKDEINTAETTTDIVTFREAIQTVIYHAYFDNDSNSREEITPLALEFLSRTQFSLPQIGEINRIIVEEANQLESLEAVYTRGAAKGEYKPWFSYALSKQLLPNIRTRLVGLPLDEAKQLVADGVIKISQLPADTQKKLTKIATAELPGAKGQITEEDGTTTLTQTVRTPQALLVNLIDDLITRNRIVRSLNQPVENPDRAAERKSFPNVTELAKSLYAKLSEEGRNFIYRGKRLSEFFDADGNPYILKSDGRYLIVPEAITPERQAEIEAGQQKERELAQAAKEQERADGVIRSFDDDVGMFIRADGNPVKGTLPLGRVRLLVNGFLSKLKIKPRTFIYANVADLKQKNPDLYARAAAAREQGDFDIVEGMGYSFGPNVIVFTDFIRTEQQLKFVLAHETLGHFGFRAVLPKAELDKILNKIYDIDPNVRAAVDAMVEIRNMDKLEAIEEYMADYAANVDASILLRIWNALKDALSKLTGIEFQDNDARYLVNLARKYVRRGDTGNILNATSIAQDMTALNDDTYSGRFAMSGTGDLASRAYSAGALNRRYGPTGGLTGVVQAFKDKFLGTQQNVPGTVARILEQVQTLDNKARRSHGLSIIYNMLERQQQHARGLLSKYQRMTEYSHRPDFGTFGELTGIAGVTEDEKEKAGELLARAALYKSDQATDTAIKSYKSLVIIDPNTGAVSIDPVVRDQLEKDGFVTAEEFRKGFDVTYSNGEKINFRADVDENSDIWKVYTEMRQAVNEAAIDMMLSNYEASQVENNRVTNRLNDGRRSTNVFSEDDLKAIRKAAQIYQDMRYKGSDVANAGVEVKKKAASESEAFVIAFGRALFNDDVFKVWMRDTTANPAIVEDLKEFQSAEYDDIRRALPSLRDKITGSKDAKQQQSFAIQKAIRDLFLFDLQSRNADYYAKRTILGSYVPFTRRGTEQVRLVAYDKSGNPVKLDETIRATLPYFQFEDRAEALQTAEDIDGLFGGDREWVMLDDDGAEVTVFLRPEVDRVRQTPDLTEAVNFNEFVYVLNRLNINVTPEVREKIVTTLTAQNARARKNLMRSGTEGWDKDVIRSVSEFLETTAHVSAKKLYRHRIDDVMLRESFWKGDRILLDNLKKAVDDARTDGERARAQRAYDEYAYMYKYMAPTGRGRTVKIAGKEEPTLGRGEDAREEAKQVLRWYSEASNITDSTEDLLSGETGSRLKMLTVLMQLGGSVATAVINLASLATHSLPYLSYYNPKTGVGGGYGEAKAGNALWAAARDLKNPNLSEAEFLQNILKDGTYTEYGLTKDEAEFLFDQTEQGTLQAAQFNALVGTARGKVFSNRAASAIKLWMSMFSYTEQMNRRATALAAYRLEKERAIGQGLSEEVAIKEATEAARTAVNTSQGEYAMFNRPEMARGNVLQYVFMYKQFVIITVQLLRAMPRKGQAMMLGFLLLTSGLKGLPFAEDIFDILDTIMQKLGLTTASVEKELSEWIDSVAPGLTPVAMRGVLDQMTGATLSSRLGMGDLVPLTGAFRAGASPIQEIENFAGPVVGGISGLVGMAGNLSKYGAESIGLRDDTTSMESILRESPLAFLRAVGDGSAYLSDGRITNTRGQVVSEDAPITTTLARFLGFYPAIASQQNDIVRLSKYVSEYAKAIKADYTSSYVKARLDGDVERMNEIVADVNEWNADAEGTGLTISNFRRSAERAAQEAERPTAARFMKSAPKAVRPETLKLLEIYGISPAELQ